MEFTQYAGYGDAKLRFVIPNEVTDLLFAF